MAGGDWMVRWKPKSHTHSASSCQWCTSFHLWCHVQMLLLLFCCYGFWDERGNKKRRLNWGKWFTSGRQQKPALISCAVTMIFSLSLKKLLNVQRNWWIALKTNWCVKKVVWKITSVDISWKKGCKLAYLFEKDFFFYLLCSNKLVWRYHLCWSYIIYWGFQLSLLSIICLKMTVWVLKNCLFHYFVLLNHVHIHNLNQRYCT